MVMSGISVNSYALPFPCASALAWGLGLAWPPSWVCFPPDAGRLPDALSCQRVQHMPMARVYGHGLWRESMASIYGIELWHEAMAHAKALCHTDVTDPEALGDQREAE